MTTSVPILLVGAKVRLKGCCYGCGRHRGQDRPQQAQRTLAGDEAGATQSRLAAGSQYGTDVLNAGNQIVGARNTFGSQEANDPQGQESIGEDAKMPSFVDELGQALISGAGSAATAHFGKKG